MDLKDKKFTGMSEMPASTKGVKGYGTKPTTKEMIGTTLDKEFGADKVMKEFTSEEKRMLFSGVEMPEVDTQEYGLGNLICTIAMSFSYTRLFYYDAKSTEERFALESYINRTWDLDVLAESAMAGRDIIKYNCEVYPKGNSLEYLKRLGNYIEDCMKATIDLPGLNTELFKHNVYQIQNNLAMAVYRLQKLAHLVDPSTQGEQVEAQPIQFTEHVNSQFQSPVNAGAAMTFSDSSGIDPDGGCIQKKPNGKWGIVSFKDSKKGKWWKQDYGTREKAFNALKAYHAN